MALGRKATLGQIDWLAAIYSGSLDYPAAQRRRNRPVCNRLAVTTFDKGNYALSGTHWRYIRYKDGNEELYDRKNDPHEWSNLAAEAKNDLVRKRFAKALDEILTNGK